MSVFGGAGGSTFGKSSTFGSFGTATQNTQPTGNLFNSFGAQAQNQNQNQNQGQQQQPTTGGQTATGNSLFPNQNSSTNPLFGGAKPPGSLFGNTATNTQPGTNAFGASNTGQQGTTSGFGAPAGNSLFGSTTNQPAQSTGLFAQTAQQNQPSSGTGLLGAFGQPAQQNQTSFTPSLFGQQQQQSAPSLFGQSNQQPQQQQQQQQRQPGIFGSFQQPAQPSTNSNGSNLFGNNQPGGSLLGLSNAVASTSNVFAPRSSMMQTQSQGDSAQAQFSSLTQKIEVVAQAWDASSPQCRFQHYFYNLVDPSQVQLYGRPQNATNEALWQKAARENPDPSCFVPALAVGYDDLQKRVEAQRSQVSAHQTKLEELKKRIAALTTTHSTSNTPRLQRALAVQTQLQQRIVRLVQHLHLLIPSVRSSSIRPEEENLRSVLESLEEEIRKPGGVGRLKGKLSELWAVIGAIEAARGRERKNGESNVEWAVVDSDGLQRLTQILAEEQNGIAYLTKIVQGHQRDLDIILGKALQERDTDAFSNPQASQMLLGASLRGAQ